jgi:hypothetical protein
MLSFSHYAECRYARCHYAEHHGASDYYLCLFKLASSFTISFCRYLCILLCLFVYVCIYNMSYFSLSLFLFNHFLFPSHCFFSVSVSLSSIFFSLSFSSSIYVFRSLSLFLKVFIEYAKVFLKKSALIFEKPLSHFLSYKTFFYFVNDDHSTMS